MENLAVGDMVLVKEDNTAPMHWPLGRVTKFFPGKDGLVRVVEILMRGKIYKRPIVKLSPLPKNTCNVEEDIIYIYCAIKEGEKSQKNGLKLGKSIDEMAPPKMTEINEVKEKNTKSKALVCKVAVVSNYGKKPKKNKCISRVWCIWSFLLTIFCTSLFLFTPISANYTIHQFTPQTTAYVEECNNVTEITGYWNLAFHTNLDIHFNNVDQLHESIKSLRTQCKNRTQNSICLQVMLNFEK